MLWWEISHHPEGTSNKCYEVLFRQSFHEVLLVQHIFFPYQENRQSLIIETSINFHVSYFCTWGSSLNKADGMLPIISPGLQKSYGKMNGLIVINLLWELLQQDKYTSSINVVADVIKYGLMQFAKSNIMHNEKREKIKRSNVLKPMDLVIQNQYKFS